MKSRNFLTNLLCINSFMLKFRQCTGNNIIKMSKNRSDIKKTLAKKLVAKGEVRSVHAVPDIEDCGTSKSQYFSPVQTRQQRKLNANLPKKVVATELKKENEELELKNIKLEENSSEDLVIESSVHWEPKNWIKVLENIRQMRSNVPAPVDSMGCHKCSDEDADEKTQRYQKLVALMLSSQTKDETTFEAMQRLKSNSLTPHSIVSMETSKLEDLLRPVSFYKNKAKYLQNATRIIIDKYNNDIPNNVKELVALPGVGPKMAHICMATAWNKVTGIGVDVHVHRITNRLRWLPVETKEPEQTRTALEAWLPRHLWREVNHLLVGFGQTVCTPLRPHCDDCLNRNICPAAYKTDKKKAANVEVEQKEDNSLLSVKKSKIQKKKIVL